MQKKFILLFTSFTFIICNSYSQAVKEKPITYEDWDYIYESDFISDAPNKASFRYDSFKSEIKVNGKKLPKCWYILVERGNNSTAIHLNMEGYTKYITVLIEYKAKEIKTQFHYKYDCIIKYNSKGDKDESLLRRGILMSRFNINGLSTGNLRILPNEGSDFYKITDIAIEALDLSITIEINKLKNN